MIDKIKSKSGKSGVTQYVGKKRLVDVETGEQFDAQTIIKEVGDQDFKKMFLGAILEKIDGFSSAKMKFILWILENADKQNRIIGTYEQLSKQSDISFPTIARLVPILKQADILRMLTPTVYMINPDLMVSVTSNGRANLLVKYRSLGNED